MAISLARLLDPGVNVMLGPVGKSPGPEVTVRVTVAVLLTALPLPSTTVTSSYASCVPSTAESVVVLDVSVSPAGVPEVGQVGAATFA
jgi:hypothetical protein